MTEDQALASRDQRSELLALCEELLSSLRSAARRWGGGFAGVSYMPATEISKYMAGHGPFAEPENSDLALNIERFEKICRMAATSNSAHMEVVEEGLRLGKATVARLHQWLSDYKGTGT